MREISLELPDKIVDYIEGRRIMIQSAVGKRLLFKEYASEFVYGLIEARMKGK